MKKLCFTLFTPLFIAASVVTVRGDVEMTQEVMSGEKRASLVTRFKQDRGALRWVRADQPDGVSLVTDFRKKRVIALANEAKTATVTTFRSVRNKYPNPEAAKAAQPTGRQEVIDGMQTEVYEGMLITPAGQAKLTLWVAKGHPQEALLVPLVQAYTESPVLKMTAGLAQSLKGVPGVIVKSEVTVGDHKVITTLKDLQQKTIPEEVFEIPKGFETKKK